MRRRREDIWRVCLRVGVMFRGVFFECLLSGLGRVRRLYVMDWSFFVKM